MYKGVPIFADPPVQNCTSPPSTRLSSHVRPTIPRAHYYPTKNALRRSADVAPGCCTRRQLHCYKLGSAVKDHSAMVRTTRLVLILLAHLSHHEGLKRSSTATSFYPAKAPPTRSCGLYLRQNQSTQDSSPTLSSHSSSAQTSTR